MKGFDEFIIVLVIAIILLIVFSLLGSFFVEREEKVDVLKMFDIGNVGFSEDVAVKVSNIGEIRTGEIQRKEIKFLRSFEISTGYFGSEYKNWVITVPEYLYDSIENIEISFDVDETNYYAPLVIEWNGKRVFEKTAGLRKYIINIDKSRIGRKNTLKVYTFSPGLYFWASTVYRLKSFRVKIGYGPSKLYAFDLSDSEIKAFSKGEIETFGIGDAYLKVYLNGIKIFDDVVDGTTVIGFNFSSAPLKVGENIIAFDSDGVVTLHGTKLKIYLMTNEIIRVRRFNISSEEYKKLSETMKGKIEYHVDNIKRDGILTIKLNGKEMVSNRPSIGWNAFSFTENDIHEGLNEIEFSGTGHFYISEAKVEIVE